MQPNPQYFQETLVDFVTKNQEYRLAFMRTDYYEFVNENFTELKQIVFSLYPHLEIFPYLHEITFLRTFLCIPHEYRILFYKTESYTPFEAKKFYKEELGVTPKQMIQISEDILQYFKHFRKEGRPLNRYFVILQHWVQLINVLRFLQESKDFEGRNELIPQLIKRKVLNGSDLKFEPRQKGFEFYEQDYPEHLIHDLKVIMPLFSKNQHVSFLKSIKHNDYFFDVVEQIRRLPESIIEQVRAMPFSQKSSFVLLHDLVSELYLNQPHLNKELNQEKTNPSLSNLLNIKFSNPDLKVVIPETSQDLRAWGKELHICVGSYDDAVLHRESIVIGITERGKIKYCLEIKRQLKNPLEDYDRKKTSMGIRWKLKPDIPRQEALIVIQFKGLQNQNAPDSLQAEFTNCSEFLSLQAS